jgi:hypothetical protein
MAKKIWIDHKKKKRNNFIFYFNKNIKKIITIPIIIGFVACAIMYTKYGWDVLEQTLLSWTIGVTIIVTIVAIIEKKIYGR